MIRSIRMRCVGLSCAILALTAAAPASAGTLHGAAAYRERIALPPDAVSAATLQDVARADAPATVIGRAPLDLLPVSTKRDASTSGKPELGTLPASFEGELPGASNPIRWRVDLFKDGRFQLRTTHVDRPAPNQFDDIGRWSADRSTGRLTLRGGREAPVYFMPVDAGAALRKLDLKGKPIESSHNDRLERLPKFAPIEPRLVLTGMFVYFADSANIALCIDNRSMPVAMEADFKALQAAYMQTRKEPMERVLVSVDGRLASRPSMEPGQPPRTNLIVERFIEAKAEQKCGGKPK